MQSHGERIAFLWGTADLIRDAFKRGHYQDVILPFTVLRRIDCVLEPTKAAVLAKAAELKKRKVADPDPQLRMAAKHAFYNTSKFTFAELTENPSQIGADLRNYIAHFSPNMAEVLENFGFENTIKELEKAKLLFKVVERFAQVDLHPDVVDNVGMGTIFEDLIRRFNEALDENPGEHFTPREIVSLMVDLLMEGAEDLDKPGVVKTVYDPCCGTGGMLTVSKDRILARNAKAKVVLFGQEVNPQTYAVCKSDMFMKSEDGKDAERIFFASTLRQDPWPEQRFDLLISNPPYGKDWKQDEEYVQAEFDKGGRGRFPAGLTPKSDGQLLFLEVMLSKMRKASDGGSRAAIVMNGSPLFTGDAGSGTSEIRRWIFQNDWLEAIIALPDQMFYNTGISTYIWVLSNRKAAKRKGKVQLIDATELCQKMRKALGDKRNEMAEGHIAEVLKLYRGLAEGERSKVFKNDDFGYRRVTVERPLRLNFQASPERLARLQEEKAFQQLAESKKKGKAAEQEVEAGKKLQAAVLKALKALGSETVWKNQRTFAELVYHLREVLGFKAPVWKSMMKALAQRDDSAEPCLDSDGAIEPDADLRDYENVPLSEDIRAYFDREVKPHVSEAWINEAVKDEHDGKVGKVGYEIPFTRHFYRHKPLRPLAEIEAEIRVLEQEIAKRLKEL